MGKLEDGLAKTLREEFSLKGVRAESIRNILTYLDSQEVVRKVEGQFPNVQSRLTDKANAKLIAEQGWSKTERLI